MADDDARDEEFGDDEFEERPLDEHETTLVQRDLDDLGEFENTFRREGYRGVAVFCHDCVEEHYYEWDMLRENLQMLIDSGETPVHEPAFAPDPGRYVPWDYARGYVDALQDSGAVDRLDLGSCPRCGFDASGATAQANFCPRCGTQLLRERITMALHHEGLPPERVDALLRTMGIPIDPRGRQGEGG